MKIKSKNYQYKIVEVAFDQLKLNNFSEESGIAGILSDNSYSEELLDLREKLLEEVYSVVNGDVLTEHQKKVLFMILMGKTQNEIAEHLGITQSAVHKALRGNLDYRNDKKRYGGIFKKLKKLCKSNGIIQEVLSDIGKLKEKVD
jgi:DNA-binding CsgD family transcriptional regulator